MLSELRLSNFRLFDNEVTVKFKPITVLIGRNNSGKSSILKLLLLLKQSMHLSSEGFPTVFGDFVQAADFLEFKNVLSNKDSLEFGLSFSPPPPKEGESHSLYRELLKAARKESTFSSIRGMYYYDDPKNGFLTHQASSTIPDRSALLPPIRSDDINILHNEFILNNFQVAANSIEKSDESRKDSLDFDTSEFGEEVERAFDDYVMWRELRRELESALYLPPIRGGIEGFVDIPNGAGKINELVRRQTLFQLYNIMRDDNELRRFVLPHLLSVADIKSVEFEPVSMSRVRPLAKHKDTGARIPIVDFGFGVSQCLPILVKGTVLEKGHYLMIEQPEAQLHPAAQLEFGSFFAELWTKRGVGCVIETHSQNILLRLRRLIAKGDLSHQDISVVYCKLDDAEGKNPVVKNLTINKDGSMEPGLPIEFFAPDIREGLKLGIGE